MKGKIIDIQLAVNEGTDYVVCAYQIVHTIDEFHQVLANMKQQEVDLYLQGEDIFQDLPSFGEPTAEPPEQGKTQQITPPPPKPEPKEAKRWQPPRMP